MDSKGSRGFESLSLRQFPTHGLLCKQPGLGVSQNNLSLPTTLASKRVGLKTTPREFSNQPQGNRVLSCFYGGYAQRGAQRGNPPKWPKKWPGHPQGDATVASFRIWRVSRPHVAPASSSLCCVHALCSPKAETLLIGFGFLWQTFFGLSLKACTPQAGATSHAGFLV